MTPEQAAYAKRWRYERSHGIKRLTNAEPARLHIATCLGAGMSLRAIAGAAGLSVQAVHRIWHGQTSAKHATVAAVLGVQPGITTAALADTTEPFVPKLGAVRRIQALIALGWPHHEQQRISGVRTAVLLNQRGTWITASSHASIAKMYDEISMTLGPSPRTRGWARRLGYAPPLAWDDDAIDDAFGVPAEGFDELLPSNPDEIDQVAVDRRMAGDKSVQLNKAEQRLLFEQWVATGQPLAELQRLTGLNPHRFSVREAA